MPVDRPFSRLFSGSPQSAHTRGRTFGMPRYYDFIASLFFLGRRRASYSVLISAAGVRPSQRVLDVGCGPGYFARLLAEVVGPDGLVVGVDPSAEMIGYAHRKASRIGQLQFQIGTAEALSFPDEQFDTVVSTLVMHHLPEDLRVPALCEMRRVLRPGGTLLVADVRVPRNTPGRVLAGIFGFGQMARKVPYLGTLATEAGFEEIRTGETPPLLRYVRAVKAPGAR
ncbi:MAG: class I SAM-dependent methyltransferase [Chloroflexi bacterium]|nr:class I SAM-dependent methyltransferase [Chloroflexota bacterium]